MKRLIRNAARNFGYEVRRIPTDEWAESLDLFGRLREGDGAEIGQFLQYVAYNHQISHAQLFQDLFVLHQTDDKHGGFFVEFGATDGMFLSNTFLLESGFGWHGILAEPSKIWHEKLKANRGCAIDLRCVWTKTGERIQFSESQSGEISTISAFKDSDYHDRSNSKEYEVETISLNDLLRTHNAPQRMDYLSIDTEGSELTILKSLDFKKWKFDIITVEHNYTSPERQQIHSLLSSNGFKRVFDNISKWDDWYVNQSTN